MTNFVFEGYQIGYTLWTKRPFIKDIRAQRTFYPAANAYRCYQDFIAEVQRRDLPKKDAKSALEVILARYIATVTMPDTLAASLFTDTPAGKFVDHVMMALDPTNFPAFGEATPSAPQPKTDTALEPKEFDYKVTLNARAHLKISKRSKVAVLIDENGHELVADQKLFDRYRNVRLDIVCSIEDEARRVFLLYALDTIFANGIKGDMFDRNTLCRQSNEYVIRELETLLQHQRQSSLSH